MTARRPSAVLGLALVMAVALTGCAGSDDAGGAANDHGEHAAPEAVAEPVDGAPQVNITAVDIDFEPATLDLDAGKPVNVTITNEGKALHDFTLEEAGLHINVEPGQSMTAGLTIDEPGDYRAICTVPGHEEAGMIVDVDVQ